MQISAIYGNAMKDRLYCEAPNSPLRRRSQTVMHRMAVALTKLLAPMLVFTADEAWEHIEHKPARTRRSAASIWRCCREPAAKSRRDDQREEWKR